ncbi:MAG TPA: hypothetical protein VM757_06245 [Sphingomicrobium sp.]|nr:hypothetical protein [Sphingomicrobium sp.]
MRVSLFIVPAALLAAPAAAQPAPPQPAPTIQLPNELLDPAWADRLTDVLQVMSKSMLEMPVGEVQAALEGRQPTLDDRRKTVRSETGMDERQMRQQIEAARPQMRAAMKGMAAALPAMMKGLSEAGREMEKATANMPQPGYPKR